jgi:hypothetical protein
MDGEIVAPSSVTFLQKGGISGGALSETRHRIGSASAGFVIFLSHRIAFLIFKIILGNESDAVWKPTPSS